MATMEDASVGIIEESTYKTIPGPVTRWPEFADESLDWNPNTVQGVGLQVGRRVARSARRVQPTQDGGGDLSMEAISKGMGLFWKGCLGAVTSTLVSGSTWQQVYTLGDTPPSWFLQKGSVEAGGTVDPFGFRGVMVDSWEFDFANAAIAMLKMTLDVGDHDAGATAYAAPSYAAGANLFHFSNLSLQTGTLTAPTTTALGSGGTPLADVRGGTIQVANNLNKGRFNGGGAGRKSKPLVGLRALTGTLDVEYDATTFRDAVLNQTPINLVINLTGGALSTGVEQLQIIVPEIKFDGELPKTNGSELIIQSMKFTGLDNVTAAQPIWVIMRTSDATP